MSTKKIQQVMENNEMKSLYEFLGRAAGPELGKKVAAAATAAKVKITSHEVSNKAYTGTILKYPVSFLQQFFKDSPSCQSR